MHAACQHWALSEARNSQLSLAEELTNEAFLSRIVEKVFNLFCFIFIFINDYDSSFFFSFSFSCLVTVQVQSSFIVSY